MGARDSKLGSRAGSPLACETHLGEISVQSFGPENGPVVIAIHGMSSAVLREWDVCAEACAEAGFRVLLPNFHSNPRTAPGLGLGVGEEDVMKILVTAISAHSKDPVILMGKSWGGAVAAKFAQRHSDMVRQLVLICPALASAAVAKEVKRGGRKKMGECCFKRILGKLSCRVFGIEDIKDDGRKEMPQQICETVRYPTGHVVLRTPDVREEGEKQHHPSDAPMPWISLDAMAFPLGHPFFWWQKKQSQPCDECSSLEDFYKDNDLVFLLFYERNLVSHHAYKGAIVAGFHEACKDLRWSRVACGIVDMLEDKVYAEKYIDPKTAPAHIAVRAGEPVPSQKEWIQKLLSKPGDKALMLWHLHQQLVPKELGEPLQISIATKEKQLEGLISKHEVVVVANLATASTKVVESFRAAVQQLVWKRQVPSDIPVPTDMKGSSSKNAARKQRQQRQRARILFVVLTQDAADAAVPRGKVAAFVAGKSQPPADLEKDWNDANIGKIKDSTFAGSGGVVAIIQAAEMVFRPLRPVLAAQKAPSPIGRRNMLQELQEVSSPSWRALPHSVPRSLWPTASCTFPALSQQDTTEKLSLYDTMEGIYTEFWQVAECGVPDSVSLDRSAEIDLSHEFPPEQREAQVDQAAGGRSFLGAKQ
ncbi:unnamed protein product [Cladocopium goreaui]|uniref:AB hydrolase-1 domain-containing protein n=1 Tax=Cladocopium goreaui TaxID=2562237 RepID=A0A9P1FLK2_9DINO|nr:unnamed protein product [Cladocopium goreaui]